ncbi:MAG: putative 2OG-Fe(II) oxygenase [Pseudomonadota bacterium]
MRKMIDLFPTPFLLCRSLIPRELVDSLVARALATNKQDNVRTGLLSHTEMVGPETEPLFREVVSAVLPEVEHYGEQLLGDKFRWTVKEMWMNVLERGGSQFMHTHANSFVSGIVYLSELDPSARTIFSKSPGANEFIFKHDAAEGKANKYNAERWMAPDVKPGDLVLYPSYLLHGVPPNQGGQRISLALNAIPDRLKSFGYEVSFAP